MDDYFSDEPGAASADVKAESPEAPEKEQGEDQTFSLPKSACPGKSVGDTVTLEIVGDHESTYEVKRAEGNGAKETETETESTPSGDEEMY